MVGYLDRPDAATPATRSAPADRRARAVAFDQGTTKFDLNLDRSPRRPAPRLDLRLEYAADLFDRATVEALGGPAGRACSTRSPPTRRRRCAAVDVLATGERAQVVDRLQRHRPPGRPVGARWPTASPRQAARTPDAVAVVFGDERLTYAELRRRADALAGRAGGAGASGPSRSSAVALPRSVELMVALVGVLKAGAAYVPLDPDLPGRAGRRSSSRTPAPRVDRSTADARWPPSSGRPPRPGGRATRRPGPTTRPT